jgi:hypothetical protein
MSVQVNRLRVQLGLNQGPLDNITTITWTDITSSVMLREGVNFSTGKAESDRVARPGSLSLTLDNSAQKGTAGRWTIGGPNVTSGWNLRVPIRVGYYDGSVVQPLWTGFVDSVSSRWEGGFRPVVSVSASDRLSRLARNNVGNRYVDEILADSPAGFWPLDDAGGSVALNRGSADDGNMRKFRRSQFSDGDGKILLGVEPAQKMGADSPLVAYAATSPLGNGQYLRADLRSSWVAASHLAETFEAMVNPSDMQVNGILSVSGVRENHLATLTVYCTAGKLAVKAVVFPGQYSSSVQSFEQVSDKVKIRPDQWNHVAVTMSSTFSPTNTTTIRGFVNGEQVLYMAFELIGYCSPTLFMTSNPAIYAGATIEPVLIDTDVYEAQVQFCLNGYLSNVAYHSSVLSDARIAERAGLINGFAGETSANRFNRICGYAGLPAGSYQTVGASQATMSAQPMVEDGTGRNLLDMVTEVANSEVGDVVVLPDGKLTLYSRSARYNPTTAWSVPAQAINADSGFDVDHTEIINTARLTNGDGTVANSSDATSVDLYDTQSIDAGCYVETTGQLEAIAYGLSHRASSPRPRLRDLSVDFITWPTTSSTDPYTVLRSQVLDVFGVTDLPAASSPTTSLRLFIEGYSDRVSESSWTRSFTASQVTAAFDPIWKLGTSVLGTSTVLGM